MVLDIGFLKYYNSIFTKKYQLFSSKEECFQKFEEKNQHDLNQMDDTEHIEEKEEFKRENILSTIRKCQTVCKFNIFAMVMVIIQSLTDPL